MPAIVEYPAVVKEALEEFGSLFKNEPERRHFAEYLTGLMIAERKTVSGISREFVGGTDRSCLSRWLNEVDWDVGVLNARRLEMLQKERATRYHPIGVIVIDNTLVAVDGLSGSADGCSRWDSRHREHPDGLLSGIARRCDKFIENDGSLLVTGLSVARRHLDQQFSSGLKAHR